MIGWIAPTDYGWYEFLRQQKELAEVNFWRPSPRHALHPEPNAPFLFKLKKPHYAICGFGYFARYSRLPDWLAWDCFGNGNGCETLQAMRDRILGLRDRFQYAGPTEAHEIGCILVVNPVFFDPEEWIPQPSDWPSSNLGPKRYDLTAGEGLRIWTGCLERVRQKVTSGELPPIEEVAEAGPRYGDPRLVRPRLGQGSFQVAVLDAYGRACAVTSEHSLPALESAHIRDYAKGGPHETRNGILLRADLHRLFDRGYLTVTPEGRLEVSSRLKEDFRNGHTYYPFHGRALQRPVDARDWPAEEYLRWHNETKFVA